MLKQARPLILDRFDKQAKPLVRIIDNINRNYSLALMLEYRLAKGKLFICNSNLPVLKQYAEAQALYNSILKYMNSPQFNPSAEIKSTKLQLFFLILDDKRFAKSIGISYHFK